MNRGDIRKLLERRIREIEARPPAFDGPVTGAEGAETGAPAFPLWRLGLEEVDSHLANGALQINALHEVTAKDYADMPAASAFAAHLALRLLGALGRSRRAICLWCVHGLFEREFGLPYGPGLQALGIDPDRVIFVRAKRDEEILWAMEEGIKSPALALVLGEVARADLKASRRLMLAAGKSGVAGLMLRLPRYLEPGAARSRWRIAAMPGLAPLFGVGAPGRAAWQVELARSLGGRTGHWQLEWSDETHSFRLAETLARRPAAPLRAAPARPGGSVAESA